MKVQLTGVYIQGGGFRRVGCAEDFAQLLEEKLGQDAADMLKQLLPDPEECCGECDRVYEMQENYETAIRDALEELERVTCTNSATNDAFLDEAMGILREALA